jgi:AP-1-like factor
MQMDFGFGDGLNFTTIASNPQYMSFADAYETLPGVHFKDSFTNDGTNDNNADDGTFDFGIMPEWPPLSPAVVPGSLEELFGIGHSNTPNLHDFSNAFPSSSSQSSLSPVSHANKVPSLTSGSSPASNPSVWNTPRESPAAIPEEANQHPQQRLQQQHDESKCPKTKESLSRHIKELGASPFVEIPPQVSSLQKVFDPKLGMVVGCAGAPQFPRTQQSDKNVEVIAAWKRITADPNFKEADINELCSQFSSKARCDGEKLVLEPQGVSQILETFTNKKKSYGP